MKLTRTMLLLLVGFSVSAPSAFACEPSSAAFFTWVYRIMHPEPDSYHERDRGRRDCSHGTPSTPSVPSTPVGPKGA